MNRIPRRCENFFSTGCKGFVTPNPLSHKVKFCDPCRAKRKTEKARLRQAKRRNKVKVFVSEAAKQAVLQAQIIKQAAQILAANPSLSTTEPVTFTESGNGE